MRTGIGIDVHRLKPGNALIVGGVNIPATCQSEGHSDGDALIHAIVDALLGAAGLGDIGHFFPSSDQQWNNASSELFLEHASQKLKEEDWEIENIDSTVILQSPKINQYIPKIRRNLANILTLPNNKISVKATTTDHLGFTGNEKGWACQSIVLLKKRTHPA